MLLEKNSQRPTRLRVTGQFKYPAVQAAYMAGMEMGIPVSILAEEGEPVVLQNGVTTNVIEGGAYIEVGTGYEKDLTKFWQRKDRIQASAQKFGQK